MIELVDPDRVSEDDVAGWHECRIAATLVDFPADPPPTPDQVMMSLVSSGGTERRVWLARDSGGRVTGDARLVLFGRENPYLAEIAVAVRPDARRSGLGRALYETAERYARDAGRTTVVSDTVDAPAPVGFATALGFASAMTEVRRVLRVADAVDSAMLATGTGAKTNGCRQVGWIAHCPDELVGEYAAAAESMNDAPLGDLAVSPARWDAERVREMERTRVAMRRRAYTLAVVENATGAVAGYTIVAPWVGSPRAEQSDTVVVPAYRGRGFGLWLKAAMVEWLRAECPWVTEYQTWNAEDNPHMIAVNDRLGYRPIDTWINWQRTVDGSSE